MTDHQPIQIKMSPDNDAQMTQSKRKRPCIRRSSSVPSRITLTKNDETDDNNDRLLPRPSSSMSVRFSPEPPQVFEYPPATTADSKPEANNSHHGPVLALPWHPT
ncbi:unnamed protein product [Absidia cylindrospora]